jgi:hypothetical protein
VTSRIGSAGQKLGPYELKSHLAGGDNGEVWLADGEDDAKVAVKIIVVSAQHRVAYLRLKRLHEELGRVADLPGVLPVLDGSLPENPTPDDPAWLATPKATPIRHALGADASPKQITDALTDIGRTLADASERGLGHGGIKPENLFRWNDRWVVSDFARLETRDMDPPAKGGRSAGARHYMGHEAVGDPLRPGGSPGDVFGLAKTLWVLLTDQHYPLPGQIRAEDQCARASACYPAGGLERLDRLIERSTSPVASERPRLGAFADELATWSDPTPAVAAAPDPDAVAAVEAADEWTQIMESSRREMDRRREWARLFTAAQAQLRAGLRKLTEVAVEASLPVSRSDNDVAIPNFITTRREEVVQHGVWAGDAIIVGAEGERPLGSSQPTTYYLFAGTGVIEREGNEVTLCAGHVLGTSLSGPVEEVWVGTEECVLGSTEQPEAAENLLTALAEHFDAALSELKARGRPADGDEAAHDERGGDGAAAAPALAEAKPASDAAKAEDETPAAAAQPVEEPAPPAGASAETKAAETRAAEPAEGA